MISMLHAALGTAKKKLPLSTRSPGGPLTRSIRRTTPHKHGRGQNILDAIGMAVILLTADRHVLLTNRAADIVLKRGDSLVIRKNLLGCADGASLTRLTRAITDTAAGHITGLALDRQGDAAPYQLTITGLAQSATPATLILFHDPDAFDTTLQNRLRGLFGLTVVEANLAVSLSQGASLPQMAGQRTVRASTIRSQIKSIAAKMRCSRQAKIAAIVARLPSLPVPES